MYKNEKKPEELIDEIIKLYISGESVNKISSTLNISKPTIFRYVKLKLGDKKERKDIIKKRLENYKNTTLTESKCKKMQEIKKFIESNNGKCLSKTYIDCDHEIKFICDKNHICETTAYKLLNKNLWCSECFKQDMKKEEREKILENLKKIAESKNGECLSEEYLGPKTKLKCKCKNGHFWESSPCSIRYSKHWCPFCAGYYGNIEDMKKLANDKYYGKCLSEKFINTKTKLKWECNNGHVWEATPNNVKRGYWCPYCSSNITEEKCRYIFEILTSKEFKKNKKELGENLELDGYNEDLKLAFEYNGEQHYEKVSYLPDEEILNIKFRDLKKEKICLDKNIKLIAIPYTFSKSDSILIKFIVDKLSDSNVIFDKNLLDIKEFYKVYYTCISNNIKHVKDICISKGGDCLSEKCKNYKDKLKIICSLNHEWLATISDIKKDKWCPECKNIERNNTNVKTINFIK